MAVQAVRANRLLLIRFLLQPLRAMALSVQVRPLNGVRLQDFQVIYGTRVQPHNV